MDNVFSISIQIFNMLFIILLVGISVLVIRLLIVATKYLQILIDKKSNNSDANDGTSISKDVCPSCNKERDT